MLWKKFIVLSVIYFIIYTSPNPLHVIHIAFLRNVVWSLLRFHVGFGNILSHDSDTEELYAADEDDGADGGSPTDDGITKG